MELAVLENENKPFWETITKKGIVLIVTKIESDITTREGLLTISYNGRVTSTILFTTCERARDIALIMIMDWDSEPIKLKPKPTTFAYGKGYKKAPFGAKS